MGPGTASVSARVVEAGWLLLAAGLPLFFAPWGRNSFDLPKAVLLWAVVAIMGAAWLVGGRRQSSPPARLGGPVLVVVVVLVLSTLLSVNPVLSAQGSYDRVQGLLSQFCYLALFLAAAGGLARPAARERLLAAVAWGTVPVMAYGLVQLLGLDPFDWQTDGVPLISSLGRANFVGAYLVLALPLTIACARLARANRARRAYWIVAGAQAVCLVATDAQAAWLGALGAGGVLLLAGAWQRGRRRLVLAALAAGGLALVGGLLAMVLIPGWTGSAGARVTIWQATSRLVAARPLLGYGPDSFGQVFTAVFPPELVYLQGRAVVVDRAHNLVLDTLAAVGVAGLVAYAALVGTTLAVGVRRLGGAQATEVRIVTAAALAAAAGHLLETMLSFQVTASAVLFWLVLAMLVAPLPDHTVVTETVEPAGAPWPRRLLGALLLVCILPVSLACMLADAHAGRAGQAATPPDLERSSSAARQAVSLWPKQAVYHQLVAGLYLERARRGDDPAAFQAAEAALYAAQRLTPGDYRVWAGLGELYTEWGLAGQPTHFDQAEAAYHRAVALFPGDATLRTRWGLLHVAQGRLAEAEEQFHQAVTLDHTDATAFRYLGDVELARGNRAGAEQAYRNALRWAPDMAAAHRGLGNVYEQMGLLEPALAAYQQALTLAPDDPELYLDVARCAWGLGRRTLACQAGARGLRLAPYHAGLLDLVASCRP